MKKRWDWLDKRLQELGISRSDFANQINWPAPRISEMLNNTPVDGGKIRNFPQTKLKTVSEILRIDFLSLWQYNTGESDDIEFYEHVASSKRGGISSDEQVMLDLYREMIPDEQIEIKDIMRGMVLRRKYDVGDKTKNGGRKSKAA